VVLFSYGLLDSVWWVIGWYSNPSDEEKQWLDSYSRCLWWLPKSSNKSINKSIKGESQSINQSINQSIKGKSYSSCGSVLFKHGTMRTLFTDESKLVFPFSRGTEDFTRPCSIEPVASTIGSSGDCREVCNKCWAHPGQELFPNNAVEQPVVIVVTIEA